LGHARHSVSGKVNSLSQLQKSRLSEGRGSFLRRFTYLFLPDQKIFEAVHEKDTTVAGERATLHPTHLPGQPDSVMILQITVDAARAALLVHHRAQLPPSRRT
jgi:hypothetical protein